MTMFKSFKAKLMAMTMAASMLAAGLFAVPALADVVREVDTEASVTFLGGDLTLDSTPGGFSFDTTKVTVNATDLSYGGDLAVTVSDARGSLAGWSLTAQMTEFTNADGATLDGATLTLAGIETSSQNSTSGEPQSPSTLELSDQPINLARAAGGTGGGTWDTEWNPTNLHVPAGNARVGTFTSTITWTLNNTP